MLIFRLADDQRDALEARFFRAEQCRKRVRNSASSGAEPRARANRRHTHGRSSRSLPEQLAPLRYSPLRIKLWQRLPTCPQLAYQASCMSPLTETVLFVFGLVALGYLAGWTGYLKTRGRRCAVAIRGRRRACRCLLFRTMVSADFHGAAPWQLWTAYFAAVIVAWTAGNLVTTRALRARRAAGVVGGVSAAFSNIGAARRALHPRRLRPRRHRHPVAASSRSTCRP